jgi:hypothetical protein
MKMSLFWKVVLAIIGFVVLAFLTFQYARIAHFPTGDDPAVHIRLIRVSTYRELLNSNYPIPEAIFKLFHYIFPIELPRLFTLTISFFFFFSVLSLLLFSKKVSKSYLIAFAASAIFATGAWVADGLRMGLLPESFGWGVLLLALVALAIQNVPLVILSAGFLAFAHPFSFTIYLLIVIMYLLILFFSKNKNEKKFALTTAAAFIIIFLLVLLLDPSLVKKFADFVNFEIIGWGERPLWLILTVSDPRRILVAIFALIGVVSSFKNWSRPGIKISYLLLFVGLFMSMNQIFGIRFLVFRFYPYLEMGLAIFAALGVEYFIEKINLVKFKTYAMLILLVIIIAPHYIGNGITTSAQVNDPTMNDSMTAGDQTAIKWIQENVNHLALIDADHKRAIWINALIDFENVTENLVPFDPIATEALYRRHEKFQYNYIYYSDADGGVPSEVSNSYKLIYDKDGVKIYQK